MGSTTFHSLSPPFTGLISKS